MKIRIDLAKIEFYIFLLLLLFSGIPYLFYGIAATKSDFLILGGLTNSIDRLEVGSFGRYFVYIKDFLAIFLLVILFPRIKRKDLLVTIIVLLYGIFVLLISKRLNVLYIVAGIRSFIFAYVTYLFFKKNMSDIDIKKILRIIEIIMLVHFFVTGYQIIKNNNIASFGGGVYRYSGAFNGAGNLGCYCMASLLFIYFAFSRVRVVSRPELYACMVILLLLAIASGTRTVLVLMLAMIYYITIESLQTGSKKISKGIIISAFFLVAFILSPFLFSWIINRVDRGNLGISGFGRVEVFLRIMSGSPAELLFGRGFGYGTNASINLGITDTFISDSSINLILVQFGFIGLFLFFSFFIYQFVRMFKFEHSNKALTIMLFAVFLALSFVGNLFEQISMSEIYFSVILLNLDQTIGVEYA